MAANFNNPPFQLNYSTLPQSANNSSIQQNQGNNISNNPNIISDPNQFMQMMQMYQFMQQNPQFSEMMKMMQQGSVNNPIAQLPPISLNSFPNNPVTQSVPGLTNQLSQLSLGSANPIIQQTPQPITASDILPKAQPVKELTEVQKMAALFHQQSNTEPPKPIVTPSPTAGKSVEEMVAVYHTQQNQANPNNTNNIVLASGIKSAVIYIRVSRADQLEFGNSVKQQEDSCREYAEQNGLKVIKIYSDNAMSGAKEDRPELLQMMRELQNGVTIIVASLSRLSRSVKHSAELYEEIKEKNCYLVLLDAKVDTSTPAGMVMMQMLSVLNQFELVQLRDRIRLNMINMSRNGNLRTKPKFGKMVVSGELVDNPPEQTVIAIIKKLIDNDPHICTSEIIDKLNKLGVKIRKCKKLYPTSINNIINDNKLRPEIYKDD